MLLDTSGNSDYSTPDLIDWSKTKCTPIYHVWDFNGMEEDDIDPLARCDCGHFEYRQFDWSIRENMGNSGADGI